MYTVVDGAWIFLRYLVLIPTLLVAVTWFLLCINILTSYLFQWRRERELEKEKQAVSGGMRAKRSGRGERLRPLDPPVLKLQPLAFWKTLTLGSLYPTPLNNSNWVEPKLSLGMPKLQQVLESILRLVVRDFVQKWFHGSVSADKSFPRIVSEHISQCVDQFGERARRNVDPAPVIVSQIVPLLTGHLRCFREVQDSVSSSSLVAAAAAAASGGNNPDEKAITDDALASAIEREFLKRRCHRAITSLVSSDEPQNTRPTKPTDINNESNEQQRAAEKKLVLAHVRRVVDLILPLVLSPEQSGFAPHRILVRELLNGTLLTPIVLALSDPDTWYQLLDNQLTKYINEQHMVEEFRSVLDLQANSMQFSENLTPYNEGEVDAYDGGNTTPLGSGGRLSKSFLGQDGLVRSNEEGADETSVGVQTYDQFIRKIDKCSDIDELSRIIDDIIAQIRKRRILIMGQNKDDIVHGERVRDIIVYINRLYVTKKKAERRMGILRSTMLHITPAAPQTQHRPPMLGSRRPAKGSRASTYYGLRNDPTKLGSPIFTLREILTNVSSLSVFAEFTDLIGQRLILEFWLNVEGVKQPDTSTHAEVLPGIIASLWKAYFTLRVDELAALGNDAELAISRVQRCLKPLRVPGSLDLDTKRLTREVCAEAIKLIYLVQGYVFAHLEANEYPAFLRSSLYSAFLKSYYVTPRQEQITATLFTSSVNAPTASTNPLEPLSESLLEVSDDNKPLLSPLVESPTLSPPLPLNGLVASTDSSKNMNPLELSSINNVHDSTESVSAPSVSDDRSSRRRFSIGKKILKISTPAGSIITRSKSRTRSVTTSDTKSTNNEPEATQDDHEAKGKDIKGKGKVTSVTDTPSRLSLAKNVAGRKLSRQRSESGGSSTGSTKSTTVSSRALSFVKWRQQRQTKAPQPVEDKSEALAVVVSCTGRSRSSSASSLLAAATPHVPLTPIQQASLPEEEPLSVSEPPAVSHAHTSSTPRSQSTAAVVSPFGSAISPSHRMPRRRIPRAEVRRLSASLRSITLNDSNAVQEALSPSSPRLTPGRQIPRCEPVDDSVQLEGIDQALASPQPPISETDERPDTDHMQTNQLTEVIEGDEPDETDDSISELSADEAESLVIARTIMTPSPGDLFLDEKIANLSNEIERKNHQMAIVRVLMRQAHLRNKPHEQRVLRASYRGLRKEVHVGLEQLHQYEACLDDHWLTPTRTMVHIPRAINTADNAHGSDNNEAGARSTTNSLDFTSFVRSATFPFHANESQKATSSTADEAPRPHVVYLIEIQQTMPEELMVADHSSSYAPTGWVVARRYREFYTMHRELRQMYPDAMRSHELPARTPLIRLQRQTDIEHRRIRLEKYIAKLLKNPVLCKSRELRLFLSSVSPDGPKNAHAIIESGRAVLHQTPQSLTGGWMEQIYKTVSEDIEGITGARPMLEVIVQELGAQVALQTPTTDNLLLVQSPIQDSGAQQIIDPTSSGAFVDPLSDMFIEIFGLRNKSNWLRRQAISILLRHIFGGAVERKTRDIVSSLLDDDLISHQIIGLRDSLWPASSDSIDGFAQFRGFIPRSDEQKMHTMRRASQLMLWFFPRILGAMVGRRNAREGARRVIDALQYRRLNISLTLSVFDAVVVAVFPEIKYQLEL